jgi:hypothetical protein
MLIMFLKKKQKKTNRNVDNVEQNSNVKVTQQHKLIIWTEFFILKLH